MRDAELIRYLVLAAQREGARRLGQGLKPLGLTAAQAEVIRVLGDHAPLTLTGLGDMLVCESGSNPSRLVDRLVGIGLVERAPGLEDRRRVTLTLTEAGWQADTAVRSIETDFYIGLDQAIDGVDPAPVVELLRRFTQGSPAGTGLQNRINAEPARMDSAQDREQDKAQEAAR